MTGIRATLVAGLLAAGLAACGGGTKASPDVAAAGRDYAAIADDVNGAAGSLQTALGEATDGSSTDTLVDDADPYIIALGRARSALVLRTWPAVAADDVMAQADAAEKLIDALSDRDVSSSTWLSSVQSAQKDVAVAAAKVRRDLHLPAAPTVRASASPTDSNAA